MRYIGFFLVCAWAMVAPVMVQAAEPEVPAALEGALARAQKEYWAGKHGAAVAILEQALVESERLFSEDHRIVVQLVAGLATIHYQQQQYAAAWPYAERLARIANLMTPPARAQHGQEFFFVANFIPAKILVALDRGGEASAYVEQVAKVLDRLPLSTLERSKRTLELDLIYRRALGEKATRARFFNPAITLLEQEIGNQQGIEYRVVKGYRDMIVRLANRYDQAGLADEAARVRGLEQVVFAPLRDFLEAVGPHMRLEQYDQALEIVEKTLVDYQAAFGTDHLYTAIVLSTKGDILMKRNRHEEALPLLQRASAILNDEPGLNRVFTVRLAEAYAALGRVDDATQVFDRLVAITPKNDRNGRPAPDYVDGMIDLYVGYRRFLGEKADPFRYLEQIVKGMEREADRLRADASSPDKREVQTQRFEFYAEKLERAGLAGEAAMIRAKSRHLLQ